MRPLSSNGRQNKNESRIPQKNVSHSIHWLLGYIKINTLPTLDWYENLTGQGTGVKTLWLGRVGKRL